MCFSPDVSDLSDLIRVLGIMYLFPRVIQFIFLKVMRLTTMIVDSLLGSALGVGYLIMRGYVMF